jgi:hypothetical protein
MDAIDGKQARRTGMAGPLGEMFDHGIGKSDSLVGWWCYSNAFAKLNRRHQHQCQYLRLW